MSTRTFAFAFAYPALLAAVAMSIGACSNRPSSWDTSPPGQPLQAYGLLSAAIVLDDPLHRAVVLRPHSDQTLDRSDLPIGHQLLSAQVAPDLSRLFVLSAGDEPRRSEQDQYPSLTVIDGSTPSVTSERYDMSEPLSNLAVDPEGHWVVAFAGSGNATSFVENPNEIVLFDLTKPPSSSTSPHPNPISRTIRSFGGTPQRLLFTPTLNLPAGPRRLLVIETDRDVSLLDLDHAADNPPRPEITVRLTNGSDTRILTPAGAVVDEGDPTRTDDSRVAIWTTNDTNVITLQLAASAAGSPNDFEPIINLTDVGGVPSQLAFVHTDGGLRVAALVPSLTSAVLVDPDTSVTEAVQFPAAYGSLAVVTGVTGSGAGGTDVALLWNASTSGGVAFWTLGVTSGQPYRSVEVLGISDDVQSVLDVPNPHPELKVLETRSGSSFYVLDLSTRTAAPLETMSSASITVSPDGRRAWAFEPHGSDLAELDLSTLHPIPLYVDRPIDAVFDVARDDGGRGLVVLDGDGNVGATVFDALAPDTATSRLYSGLLLEGL
jgi:hypothetical protein